LEHPGAKKVSESPCLWTLAALTDVKEPMSSVQGKGFGEGVYKELIWKILMM
jgi:hypothetical protein